MKVNAFVLLLVCILLPLTCLIQGAGSDPSKSKAVGPYLGVRNMDLRSQSSRLNEHMIQTLWFNWTTIWPGQFRPVADGILEKGKNPGLGVRALHDQGITGKGGLSWSIPYLAGVFAMGWQVRPDLTGENMISLAFKSASIRGGNCHIINPPAFIDAIRKAGKSGQ